jgi:hypothetical protein
VRGVEGSRYTCSARWALSGAVVYGRGSTARVGKERTCKAARLVVCTKQEIVGRMLAGANRGIFRYQRPCRCTHVYGVGAIMIIYRTDEAIVPRAISIHAPSNGRGPSGASRFETGLVGYGGRYRGVPESGTGGHSNL